MNPIRLLPLVLAASLAAFAPAAHAASGMFCFSAFTMRLSAGDPTGQKIAVGQNYVNNATVFTCSGLGNYTVPQLIALGWHVNEPTTIIPPVIIPITQTTVTAHQRILISK